RTQARAFAAGSVWVFAIATTQQQRDQVALSCLGERTGEGFGTFVLNWHGSRPSLEHRTLRARVDAEPPRSSDEGPPLAFTRIDQAVRRQRWEAAVRAEAVREAGL